MEDHKSTLEKLRTNDLTILSLAKVETMMAVELAEALKSNTSVVSVDCNQSWFTMEAAHALADALAVNQSVTDFFYGSNSSGEDCAMVLCEVLKTKNKSIKCLRLNGSNLGLRGCKLVAEVIETNQSLTDVDLRYNSRSGIEGMVAICKALKKNSTIRTLDLSYNQMGSGGGVRSSQDVVTLADALKVNQSLTSLFLMSNSLGPSGARLLAEALKVNRTLQRLHISTNQLGPEGTEALCEVLEKSNRTVRILDLEENKIGDEGVRKIARALSVNHSVQCMYLGYNKITLAALTSVAEMLKKNPEIREMDFTQNAFDWADTKAMYAFENAVREHGMLVQCRGVSADVTAICYRNGYRHRQVRACVERVLAIRRFRRTDLCVIVKEVVAMIALYLMKTKADVNENFGV